MGEPHAAHCFVTAANCNVATGHSASTCLNTVIVCIRAKQDGVIVTGPKGQASTPYCLIGWESRCITPFIPQIAVSEGSHMLMNTYLLCVNRFDFADICEASQPAVLS